MAVKAKVDKYGGNISVGVPEVTVEKLSENGIKQTIRFTDLEPILEPIVLKGEVEMSDYKETKIVVRRVGAMIAGDALTVSEVEPYLNSILADGWKLFSVMHLETAQEGYTFAWMFVR